jgi:acetyl esterase/lipase
MIFVHGGNWNSGDKDLKVSGADVYGNIGRFFASEGIATAVISYRLMPTVDWKAQVMDVAKATAWIYKNIRKYQGDPRSIFLAGHSAGAQIASRVALDPSLLNSLGLSPSILCGVIPISGVAYNFMNAETYEYGKKEGLFEELFNQADLSQITRKNMSPLFFVNRVSPPFLIMYAAKDNPIIQRDSKRLDLALRQVGAQRQLYRIPRESHTSMILALSRANKFPASLMTVFMKTSECGTSATKKFNSSPPSSDDLGKSPTAKSNLFR